MKCHLFNSSSGQGIIHKDIRNHVNGTWICSVSAYLWAGLMVRATPPALKKDGKGVKVLNAKTLNIQGEYPPLGPLY